MQGDKVIAKIFLPFADVDRSICHEKDCGDHPHCTTEATAFAILRMRRRLPYCGARVYQQYYRDDAVTTEPAFTGFEMALLYDAVKTACSALSPLSVETTVITIAFICGVCPSTAPLW